LVAIYSVVFLFLFILTGVVAQVVLTSGTKHLPGTFFARSNAERVLATPSVTPMTETASRQSAPRIVIAVGETYDLQIATGADSIVVVSPEIASAAMKNRYLASVSALKIGETMLIATYGGRRQTYIIEVTGKQRKALRAEDTSTDARDRSPVAQGAPAGSLTTTYVHGTGTGRSLVRQTVDLRKKLSDVKTVRVSGELFRQVAGSGSDAMARIDELGFNHVAVGLDAGNRSIDILDSQLNTSPLSFNGYTMRGFHLVDRPKAGTDAKIQKKGLEVYAGLGRPSPALFDVGEGKVAGVMIPIASNENFQVRVGSMAVAPKINRANARAGVVAHTDAIYSPAKGVSADAEASFANGDFSWRTRLDIKKPTYGGSAEIMRFANTSPLNAVGAQPGGRESELFSFYWRPAKGFAASGGYNHSMVSREGIGTTSNYDRSLAFANVNLSLNQNSRINLRYADQKVRNSLLGSAPFEIRTRTLSAGHNIRFNRHVSNSFEARANFSDEGLLDESLETGFSLREQLRAIWNGTSLIGTLNYTNKTPSLAGLVLRNPQILPTRLQESLAQNAAAFFSTYRDRLAFLLGGVELPLTRSLDAGLRLQKTFSRFTVSADTRYNAGDFHSVSRNGFAASGNVNIRLNKANSIQVSAGRAFGAVAHSGASVSFTHRLGESLGSFRLSSLFPFNRPKVRGRVFNDLNGNGVFDQGEPGLGGMKLEVDGGRTIVTQSDGRYEFTRDRSTHRVALVTPELGVRLLATSPTERLVITDGSKDLAVDFGVRDHGSIRGRVFNDAHAASAAELNDGLGLAGVRIVIRSAGSERTGFVLERLTDAAGRYDFSNLRPGKYLVELDPTTLPPNFRIPSRLGDTFVVEPLGAALYDIAVAAQRSVSGVVYVDIDGNGSFTPGKDRPVRGAAIELRGISLTTDETGRYLFRNLPAGRSEIIVRPPASQPEFIFPVDLGTAPESKASLDIAINRHP
jgi:hypothetical protein